MSAQTEKLAVAGGPVTEPIPEPAARRNRGWFGQGDRRINREGRPKGSAADAPAGVDPADCAPRADRLMRLVVEEPVLACCLACVKAPYLVNLPPDFRVVGCRFDAAGQRAVLTIWSATFPRVAKGAPVPEFEPRFHNLIWVRRRGVAGIFPAR